MKTDIQWANAGVPAEQLSTRYNVTPLTPAFRVDPQFEADVLEGLDDDQKHIPSIWLYDRRGSELFEEITEVAEYYPTRTETRLLAGLAPELESEIGGVPQAPPRSTNWPAMNLPLYSPTAPGAGLKRG